jgi:hypothetical protein
MRSGRCASFSITVIYHLIDRLHGGTLLVNEADNLGLNVNRHFALRAQ